MVAGGADSRLNLCGLLGYARLGALSTGWNRDPAAASRPFAADRDGFVMGEGAAFLVLEERERALRRGATVWAEVAGWASTCDAFRVTDPHPDGDGSSRCIELALASAGIGPESIDYINAHGTGTPANDRAEYRALRRVFGDKLDRTPVSSIKSMIGHFSMAAGSIEAICSAITLKKSWICPTLNAENLDPEFSGDFVVGRGRSVPVSWVLKNSFGFGGQNSCLVLRRADL
jgi:3-oxoacyl-[acyl-carrier-protein] synthase II